MKISIDSIKIKLFYLFALFAPLEYLINQLYGENYLFKPYRIIAIVIICLSLFNFSAIRCYYKPRDLLLHLSLLFGIITTVIRWIYSELSVEYFFIIFLQFMLYYIMFIAIKSSNFGWRNIRMTLVFFTLGCCVSLISMLIDFFIMGIKGDRLAGYFQNVNSAGFAFSVCSIFLLFNLFYINSSWYIKIFSGLLSLLFALGIFFTGSRGALILLFLGFFIIFYFLRIKVKFAIILSIPIVIFIAFDSFYTNIYNGSNLQLRLKILNINEDVRYNLGNIAKQISKENYYFGIGMGQFYFQSPKYFRENYNPLLKGRKEGLSTHNTYYTVLCEWGIISFIFFIIFNLEILLKRLKGIKADNKNVLLLCIFLLLITSNWAGDNLIGPVWWLNMVLVTIRI